MHGSLCNGSFASGNGSFDYELKVEQGCSTTKPTPIVPFTNTMTNEKMNNEKSITVPLAKASSDQTTESDTTTTSSITSEDSSHTTYFSTMTSTEGGQISSSTETFAETSELSTVLTTTQKMAETNNPPSYTQTAENISTIELCVCSCSPGLLKDNPAEFEKLLSELRVQPNETSRARRRRASMMDQRLTAAAVGVVAWACLMASLTWFVVADAFAFFKNVRKAIRRSWQKKRETSQA
ncbi:A-agglutinin anchorage subunit-like [Aplysia californica]|uniref:A-agglutinin anchorage subunit-like n=1 Tax=Aplysia californica TaxID=6500 RepID=A0ABM1VZN5_APLCA|nr:A-agglutinin anchorage subunit-like [Aplysia californica]